MMMMTCSKCDTKQSITFTKRAYYNGALAVTCQGCPTVHLVADNIGFFNDEKINIEQIMQQKGEEVKFMQPDQKTRSLLLQKIEETKKRNSERPIQNKEQQSEGEESTTN